MRKGWVIALVLLLLGIAGAYIWYSRLKSKAAAEGGPYDTTLTPRLELTTIDITNISDEKTDLTVRMLIDNPLPVKFAARRLRYTVLMANTPIIEDAYEKPIMVKSGDSTLVTLPMHLFNKKLLTVLNTLDRKDIDSTTYTFRATFDLDVPIFNEHPFKLSITRRLPTVYLPEIKVVDIDLGALGLKRTDVAAKVNVTNRNQLPFNIADANYTVSIDGKEIATGSQAEPILIKAKATTPVVFPVTVRPGQSLELLPKILFDKKDTPFLVTFRCKIIDKKGDLAFKNSRLNTTIRGTLADLRKTR